MHWLPLVAMVIASALPFPHEPAARIVAASLPPAPHHAPDYNSHRPADYDAAPADYDAAPADYDAAPADYDAAPADYDAAEHLNQRNFMTNDDSGVYNLNSVNTLEVPPTESTPVRTQDVTEDAEINKNNVDFNSKNDLQDSATAAGLASPTETADLQRTEKGLEESLDAAHLQLDGLFGGDMFLDAHPRVLFSPSPPKQPPPLLMLEEGGLLDEELGWVDALADGHGARREKRSHQTEARWGQRSVCESVNVWVTDKTTAVDTKGNKVSIIQEIQTQSGPIKQYFYETRCRQAELPQDGRHEETGVDGASCLGIDKKQWKSKCIAKPSFVRALTKDANNRIGWRWIRIDASCVCVLLSRTNNKAPSGRGRG